MINQISVFLENSKGRLSQMTRVLADAGVDLLALSIADTTNFGILRTIVSDDELAVKVLKEHGYTVSVNRVLVVVVPDHSGGLSHVLDILNDGDVGIEYLYSFVSKRNQKALIVFKVNDKDLAVKVLEANKVSLLDMKSLLESL